MTRGMIGLQIPPVQAYSFGMTLTHEHQEKFSKRIIGAAIEVHRHLGPGLLESNYEECLCIELADLGLRFREQVVIPVIYKGHTLKNCYRPDLIVESAVIVEVKCVESWCPSTRLKS